jgi:hypothetical protein
LSTAILCGRVRDGSDTEVASTDDIHMPVEKPRETPNRCNDDGPAGEKPPGQFVSDELEEQTKRFLDEVKDLAKRRRKAANGEKRGPPPPDDQRSRRR